MPHINKKFKILRIAIPSPLRRSFDYLTPDGYNTNNLIPGMRIQVPFGKSRTVIGILLEVTSETEIQINKLKTIITVLDEVPIWPELLLKLGQWASQYYNHPIGEVLVGVLPPPLRLSSKPLVLPDSLDKNTEILINTQNFKINPQQSEAIASIAASNNQFQAFLLDGITGSGKTEVYLQAIYNQLQQGKQALVLVPEITLTPQIITRFKERFNVPIVVLHSGLTPKKRATAWLQAYHHQAAIIIGTRSAIFTPLVRPGIIILDEEHDPSFKQQTGFRYSARDVAIMRARLENIPIVLGSATPSFESLRNAEMGRYSLLSLPKRAGTAISPDFHLIDMRGLSLEYGLSEALLTQIRQHLIINQGQILLFLNRRGYSPILLCHTCAWSAQCKHCDAKLTLHQSPKRLHCHHCEAVYPIPLQCPECKSKNKSFITVGLGTERLEEGLQKYFPDTEVLRIDSDSINGKGKLDILLDKIYAGTPCIITGTQMLAKGHHFPNVTMAAIVDADAGLYSADFRASERMAQLIIQVAGRAGRGNKPGQVFIQTHNPEHPILQSLVSKGYSYFAKQILKERQDAELPPYAYLALIRAESAVQEQVYEFLNKLHKHSKQVKNTHINYCKIKILGPIAALLERKGGRFRAQLLFQAENRAQLQQFLNILMPIIEKIKTSEYKKIRWSIDIDPIEVL